MKAKRVECSECELFIWPKLSKRGFIKKNAQCKLEKRVMFRVPTSNPYNDCGYYRYCNDFKAKS